MPTFLDVHRGPFVLCLSRPATRPNFWTTEWGVDELSRDVVEETAQELLTTPHSTVDSVHVWSVTEECFIGGYNRRTVWHRQ